MTGAKKCRTIDFAGYKPSFGHRIADGNTAGSPCADIISAGSASADVGVEFLHLYTTHLESLVLQKNSELYELQSSMESRIEAMRQKQAAQERVMLHQARHAAMGELLGAIAHQWRQPLNGVSIIVQNIKDAWEYGELDEEYLNLSAFKIVEQITMLSRTLDDFRMFLNPEVTTQHFIPMRSIEEIVGLISGWFSNYPDIIINAIEGAENFQVAGCQNSFNQVILNLLGNANDAIQERQRLIGPEFRGRIEINFTHGDYDAVMTVSDNGGGIAETAMEQLFMPYFTTKTKEAIDIGIGLYISKLIIENSMGGELWAENIPEGALFGLRLPASITDGGQHDHKDKGYVDPVR